MKVTDNASHTSTVSYTVVVASTPVTVTTSGLGSATVGRDYSAQLSATGGASPYTWSLASGALPPGLSLVPATGIIYGVPSASGTYTMTVKATDSNGLAGAASGTLTVAIGTITISPQNIGSATQSVPYSSTLVASGGASPYTWSVTSGGLPSGLALGTASGTIAGTPSAVGAYSFSVRVVDANSASTTVNYSMNVLSQVVITTTNASLAAPHLNTAYSQTFSATGGAPPYTWSLFSGALPDGLTLAATGGVVSGTPTVPGAFTFTLKATDNNSFSTAQFTLNVTGSPSITITPSTLAAGTVGTSFSQAFSATGGATPYTWSASGSLPPGLLLSPSGNLTGTPSLAGNYTFVVMAKDNTNTIGTRSYTMTVNDPAPPLAGRVRRDLTSSGNPTASTNVPLAGVMVYLYADPNGDGVLSAAEAAAGPVASDMTDANGNYLFTTVPAGKYLVVQELLPGAVATYDTDGGDKTCTAINATGKPLSNIDFLQTYEPTGMFYCSGTGQLVPGGKVVVTGPGTATVHQDGSSGRYCFAVDTEGDYTLAITAPTGYFLDTGRAALTATWTSSSTAATVKIGAGEDPANPGFLTTATATANPWYRTLHIKPGVACPVDNNIPVLCTVPDTFVQWQDQNMLNGSNAVHDNSDGDLYDNLLEYALGLEPTSGVLPAAPVRLEVSATGTVDAVFQRRSTGHMDVTYRLEGSTDLVAWTALPLAPGVEPGANGYDTVRFADIAGVAMFNGAEAGFVRLKVALDADHNGTPEATSTSPVLCFSLHALPVAQTTLSMPLLRNDVFEGTVKAVSTGTLDISGSVSVVGLKSVLTGGRQYYLEVLDGASEGLRLDLDETATTDRVITVEAGSTVPTSLAGAHIAVRAHQTLNDLLPPGLLHASDSSTTADRVMFFNGASYDVKWLSNSSGQPRWVAEGDASQADVGSRIIGPAEGLMVQARTAVTVPLIGALRTNAFRLPLTTGAQLIGSGWPVAQSPASRYMNAAAGFTASTSATAADRMRIWLGDTTAGATAYDNYFFFASTTPAWTHEGDAANASVNDKALFKPFRAAFIITTQGAANWKLPKPF